MRLKQFQNSRILILLCLILAGEVVFSLPFHITRFFRPTVLEVFNISNTELGDIFALYGLIAMLSYFPGGAIADNFNARKLLASSLWLTAVGGLYFAQIPSHTGLLVLFAYWGCTSILLFWAALIKATREWGGYFKQGRAFGFLDGGRGLIAAGLASLIVILFAKTLPIEAESATHSQLKYALQMVIYAYTLVTFLSGIIVWWLIPNKHTENTTNKKYSVNDIKSIIARPVIWLQAIVVICAYCAYKGLDNYALYANQVLGMNDVESAEFTSAAAYLRPIAAISAGFIADRFIVSKVIKYSFLILVLSYILLFLFSPSFFAEKIIIGNILISFTGVYAIRGVYFALLDETNTSANLTGTAVGVISVIGFTPDIFFHSLAGRILDASPGLIGHQNFFLFLAIISIFGMLSTIAISQNHMIKSKIN